MARSGTLFQCCTRGGTAVSQLTETRQTEATVPTMLNCPGDVRHARVMTYSLSLIVRSVALYFIVSVGGVGMSCAGLCLYFSVGTACVPHTGVFISPFLACCSSLCWCSLSPVVRSSPSRDVALSGRFGAAVDSTCVSCGTSCGPEGAGGCVGLRIRRF